MTTSTLSGIRPATARQVIRFASINDVIEVAKRLYEFQCLPNGVDRWEKLVPMLLAGAELGLGVMATLKSVTPAVNGVCALYGDVGLAMVRASGELVKLDEFAEGTDDGVVAVCLIQRADHPEKRFEYPLSLAKKLVSYRKQHDKKVGPWFDDPMNMLKWRARWRAMRTEFTDVLHGMSGAEEAEDAITVESLPQPLPQPPAALPQTGTPTATDDQLTEISRLRELVGKQLPDGGDLRAVWADLLKPFGVESARALTRAQANEFCHEVGAAHDPFTYPAAAKT